MRVGFFFLEEPFRFELLDYLFSRLAYLHPRKLSRDGEELAELVYDLLLIQAVTLGDLEVGLRVPWRYRHDAGAESHIDGSILDDCGSYGAVYPFKPDRLSVLPLLISLIVGMHDDVLVAELRFGSCGADGE